VISLSLQKSHLSDEIKKRVVLASVLKPVDDTRMLEKIGATLLSEGFEVFIIGYPSSGVVTIPGISVLPLPKFNRASFKRLLIPWIIVRKINQVKPEIIIINTPELLLVTILNKIFFGRNIVYDILENYFRTIRYTPTYPRIFRGLLAAMVRLTEVVFSPFIDRFLLAEKGYASELKFVRQPVILENKLPKKVAENFKVNRSPYHNLLFSGTLAPTTGVFEAIKLSKELHAINPDYTLTIIGYAALPEVLIKIRKEIADSPFIELIGGDKLIPHEYILHEISKAGTGIVIYPPNPGTESSIPTKLYEYLALKLPVIISHNEASGRLVKQCNAGIVLQNGNNTGIVNEQLANSSFTFECREDIFWEEDAIKLIGALKF
jgi:glycosyltransferase involved in cell wall biosynthesis